MLNILTYFDENINLIIHFDTLIICKQKRENGNNKTLDKKQRS